MLHVPGETGHRDLEGNWIDEPSAAKLRNSLSSFWTLSKIISDEEMREKLLKTDEGQKLLIDIAQRCEESKGKILGLIEELAK